MTIHCLKTWPEHFEEVLQGRKPFEIRRDDRGFQVGDLLCLQEWDPVDGWYTGRELQRRVSCLTRTAGPLQLLDDLVVLGLEGPEDLGVLKAEQARLGAVLHQVAELLGVPFDFGAVEEEALLSAARAVKADREALGSVQICEFGGA